MKGTAWPSLSSAVRRWTLGGASLCVVAQVACTYGPVEDLTRVEQIVALGDSFKALVVIRHDRYRRPTGLSAFPDGGKWRYEERQATNYLIDAAQRTVVELLGLEAPDSLWESFSAGVRGLEGDSVAYVALTGCPRGGQCYPELGKTALLRLSTTGEVRPVVEMPASARLPGIMLARRSGERNYVRYSQDNEFVTARFEEDGPYRPIFRVTPAGVLEPSQTLETQDAT